MNDVTETFNRIYDATFRELMRYCLLKAPLEDARDLLQNTYAKFYRALCRKGIRAICDPKSYLFITLKREIADFYRSDARKRAVPLELASDEPDDVSVEALCLDRAAIDDILDRLRSESKETQRVFLLHYGYGMKIADIARETGATTASVKSRLARVRRSLRQTFGEEKNI